MSNNMIVMFRVDASIQMGSGHIMRCLTLADALSKKNAYCFFICRQHSGNMISFIKDKGYTVLSLPRPKANWQCITKDNNTLEHAEWLGATQGNDAQESINALQLLGQKKKIDWIIVDHYALDYRWHQQLKTHAHKLMVIDDLADRQHDCNLLLDQTFGRSKQDYLSLVPNFCTILTGSQYALLRPEFSEWREYSLKRRSAPEFKHLLITLGGIDKDNVTSDVLTAIASSSLPANCRITVVMGASAPWLEKIKRQTESLQWKTEVKVNVTNMAQLMANSDLCIGAAGSTTWERCCLGLPTILLILAENQKFSASILVDNSIVRFIDNTKLLANEIFKVVNNHEILANLSIKSSLVSSGNGTEKILRILEKRRISEVN